MDGKAQLGQLQLRVMQVLWKEGKATAASIHRILMSEREIALTTVATVLQRLEKNGLLAHDTEGRQFVYRANVQREEIQQSAVKDLMARLFRGDPGALVNSLVSESEVNAKDLDEIAAIIEEAKRRKSR